MGLTKCDTEAQLRKWEQVRQGMERMRRLCASFTAGSAADVRKHPDLKNGHRCHQGRV